MAKYFVVSVEHKGKKQFVAIDAASGGYPYWTDHFPNAKFYLNKEEAEGFLTNEFSKQHSTLYMFGFIKGPFAAIVEEIVLSTVATARFSN